MNTKKQFSCDTCGKPFYRYLSQMMKHGVEYKSAYCSKGCRHIGHQHRVMVKCEQCGKEFRRAVIESTRRNRRMHWCCRRCYVTWKYERLKSYPKIGLRHAHRVVVEQKLKRQLRSDEIVHHRDENKKNYNISNLQLTTRADHARYHFHGIEIKDKVPSYSDRT